jgi:hypothetical protein
LGNGFVDAMSNQGTQPTPTTGDFARMDGAGYRGELYDAPNAAGGLRFGGGSYGLQLTPGAVAAMDDGINEARGGRILAAIRDADVAHETAALNAQNAARVASENGSQTLRELNRFASMAQESGAATFDMRELRRVQDAREAAAYALQPRPAPTYMSAWDGKSGVYADQTPDPRNDSFHYAAARGVQDAAVVIAAPEMATAKVASLFAWGARALSGTSTPVATAYESLVASVPGRVVGEFSQGTAVGPLATNVEVTFSGSRYAAIELDKPMTLYRAWAPGSSREFGGFWSMEQPVGSLQARIDSALAPEWGQVQGTAFRSQATQYTAIEVPAGTRVYAGQVASQGGSWVGGRSQFLIEGGANPAWKTGGGALK